MDELINVVDERYHVFEGLLRRRDEVRKEALHWGHEYIKFFGELECELYEIKKKCIAAKKQIAYCLMAINRGEKIDREELEKWIEAEMREYEEKLEQMRLAFEESNKDRERSDEEMAKIKSLYYKIAKRIHPDANPDVANDPDIQQLWTQVSDAYERNDLEALEELDVLVTACMANMGRGERPDLPISYIDLKIKQFREQILEITSKHPWLYSELFESSVKMYRHRNHLKEEIDKYNDYFAELSERLKYYIQKGAN